MLPVCAHIGSLSMFQHWIGRGVPTKISYSGSAGLFGSTMCEPSSSAASSEYATVVPSGCSGNSPIHEVPICASGNVLGTPSPTRHEIVIDVTCGGGHAGSSGVVAVVEIARSPTVGGATVVVVKPVGPMPCTPN